jgi:hypothetical protein
MGEPMLDADNINTFFSIMNNAYSFFNSLPIDNTAKQIFMEELTKELHILIPSLIAVGSGIYLLIKEEIDEVGEYKGEMKKEEEENKLMKEIVLTGLSIALIIGGTVGTSVSLSQINQNIQQRLSQLGGGESTSV